MAENQDALPKSFDDLVRFSERPVLVDFWAEWCAPCRMVSPVVERIAKEYAEHLTAVKVNVDRKSHIAARYNIQSIPTIMMFWKGKSIMRAVGAQSYAQLKQQIALHWPEVG